MDTSSQGEEEPLAYRIGDQPFFGLKIYLDSRPLIPRPETEWWTERLFEEINNSFFGCSAGRRPEEQRFFSRKIRDPKNDIVDFRILDLCAGSGAIGCAALARLPGAQVYFGEIDPAHEATILKNIRENGLDEPRAHIRIGDLFEPFGDMQFDIIAANPPYIPEGRELPPSVADYEPALALYAGPDGLDLIRRIAEQLPRHLAPSGVAWIECDSAHATAACALFSAQGLTASVRPDQYGIPRIIVVE